MHKYYVSITEAAYNSKTQTFEISVKFIGHDLEHVLENAGAPEEMYMGTDKEFEKADDYIKKYIDSRLQITVDGKPLSYTYVGKEVNDDDFIYCYLESNKLKSPKKIEIKNTLLTELFPGQVNTVYLTVGEHKLTYTFDKSKVSEIQEIKWKR